MTGFTENEWLLIGFGLLQQAEQPVHHLRGPAVVINDVGQDLAHFIGIQRRALQEALGGLGIT